MNEEKWSLINIGLEAREWLGVDEVRMDIGYDDPPLKRNAVFENLILTRSFHYIYFSWRIGENQWGVKFHPYTYLRSFEATIPHPNPFRRLFGKRIHGTDWQLDFDGMMLDLRELVLKEKKKREEDTIDKKEG